MNGEAFAFFHWACTRYPGLLRMHGRAANYVMLDVWKHRS